MRYSSASDIDCHPEKLEMRTKFIYNGCLGPLSHCHSHHPHCGCRGWVKKIFAIFAVFFFCQQISSFCQQTSFSFCQPKMLAICLLFRPLIPTMNEGLFNGRAEGGTEEQKLSRFRETASFFPATGYRRTDGPKDRQTDRSSGGFVSSFSRSFANLNDH